MCTRPRVLLTSVNAQQFRSFAALKPISKISFLMQAEVEYSRRLIVTSVQSSLTPLLPFHTDVPLKSRNLPKSFFNEPDSFSVRAQIRCLAMYSLRYSLTLHGTPRSDHTLLMAARPDRVKRAQRTRPTLLPSKPHRRRSGTVTHHHRTPVRFDISPTVSIFLFVYDGVTQS